MALSTLLQYRQRNRSGVIYPVTPNGVEHTNRFGAAEGDDEVIYPVTPNGVEH